jgi:hypothetical protein
MGMRHRREEQVGPPPTYGARRSDNKGIMDALASMAKSAQKWLTEVKEEFSSDWPVPDDSDASAPAGVQPALVSQDAPPEVLTGLSERPTERLLIVARDHSRAPFRKDAPGKRTTRQAALRFLTSGRSGLRQAILAQEVLGPPKSLRPPDEERGDG